MKTYNCKNCGAVLEDFIKGNSFKCEYCNSINYIEEDSTEDATQKQKINSQYVVQREVVERNGRRYCERIFNNVKTPTKEEV